jgi:hypothetical protein
VIYDGTNLKEVRAHARNGKIIAVVWGWRKHKIVKTKKLAAELIASLEQDAVVHEYDAETLDRLWMRGDYNYRLVHDSNELQITQKVKRAPRVIDPDAPKKYGKTRKPIGV